jgi:hypothetical protein
MAVPILPNTQYTVKSNTYLNANLRAYFYATSPSFSYKASTVIRTLTGDSNRTITFTSGSTERYAVIGMLTSFFNKGDFLSDIQLELGATATSYSPHAEQFFAISGGGILAASVFDAFEPCVLVDGVPRSRTTQRIGKINSYAAESITTAYMSSTGGLGMGATIYYVLDTPVVTLGNPVTLESYNGITNIYSTSAVQGNLRASVLIPRNS